MKRLGRYTRGNEKKDHRLTLIGKDLEPLALIIIWIKL